MTLEKEVNCKYKELYLKDKKAFMAFVTQYNVNNNTLLFRCNRCKGHDLNCIPYKLEMFDKLYKLFNNDRLDTYNNK